MIRTYNFAPNISRLNKHYIPQGTFRLTLRQVLNAFEDSINTIGNQNDNKAKWIKMSWHLILIGLVLVFIFFILTISYK